MKQDKTASYIGLAMKAGRIASGEFAVEKAVKEGKAYMVILSADASDNTKRNLRICAAIIRCLLRNTKISRGWDI